MELETMRPDPAWDAIAYQDAVNVFAELHGSTVFKVWGGDWCTDCRSQLPEFGAALDAANIPNDRIEHYPVEKADDGSKIGPAVDEYGITRIPTVVVEIEGEEVARFVEKAERPIAVSLADDLSPYIDE